MLGALQPGVNRPGKLERYIPGISTKVLTKRLRRLLHYGLITRQDRSGVALHVEYTTTPTGAKLAGIIEQLHELEAEHDQRASAETTAKASPRNANAGAPRKRSRASYNRVDRRVQPKLWRRGDGE